MKDIIIRKAQNVDIRSLVTIIHDYGKVKKDYLEKYINKHIDSDLEIYVAELEKEYVAVFCLSYLTLLPRLHSDNSKSSYLPFYYIKPQYEFLQEKMFKIIIDSAKKQNAGVFELGVSNEQIPTCLRHGFEESEYTTIELELKNIEWDKWIKKETGLVQFRKAGMKDISDLVTMRTRFLYDVSCSEKCEEEKDFCLRLEKFFIQHLNNDIEAFVAEDNGDIISVCFTIYFERISCKKGIPVNAYTLPEYRGKGYAKALFAISGKYAEKQGINVFDMEVPKNAVTFYDVFGFKLSESKVVKLRL